MTTDDNKLNIVAVGVSAREAETPRDVVFALGDALFSTMPLTAVEADVVACATGASDVYRGTRAADG
jgi:hypothetical protein